MVNQDEQPIKRGVVVKHINQKGWTGVVVGTDAIRASVKWFKGRNGGTYVLCADLTPVAGHEFEAALALGDEAKVLEMYRGLQQELKQVRALFEDGVDVEDHWA